MNRSPRAVPLYDTAPVHGRLHDELVAAFDRVLTSGHFIDGEEVELFEAALAARVGSSDAVGVASGTAALHLALVAAGIGPGDEVVLPPNTYFATAEAVVAAGARPVFADVDPQTALIDPEAVEAALTPSTAAIVAVHLYGQPADTDAIGEVARRHGLFLLEDAAQALGATWARRPVGSLGDAAAFSFYPSKTLGALGDGGAVTTSDSVLARRVRQLRDHGQVAKNVHGTFGFNERLDALQAAFLSVKFAHMADMQAQRVAAAAAYATKLGGLDGVELLRTSPSAGHVHHLLVTRVRGRRDIVLETLRRRGVEAAVHYPTPIHLQPAFAAAGGLPGQFPVAEQLANQILSLPLFPGIDTAAIERCVSVLAGALAVAA
jgi:dTDP-4-amino-4,6-dideoxygalactose transaminase